MSALDLRIDDNIIINPDNWSGNLNINLGFKVLLVATNNFVQTGVRYCLEGKENVYLKSVSSYDKVISTIDTFEPDVIILVESSALDVRGIFCCLMHLKFRENKNKVAVISGQFFEFFCCLEKRWHGFLCIDADYSIFKIRESILRVFSLNNESPSFINDLLSKKELIVLMLASQGYTSSEISSYLKISVKTVSARKVSFLRKLGIYNKLHEAWLMHSINESFSLL